METVGVVWGASKRVVSPDNQRYVLEWIDSVIRSYWHTTEGSFAAHEKPALETAAPVPLSQRFCDPKLASTVTRGVLYASAAVGSASAKKLACRGWLLCPLTHFCKRSAL